MATRLGMLILGFLFIVVFTVLATTVIAYQQDIQNLVEESRRFHCNHQMREDDVAEALAKALDRPIPIRPPLPEICEKR